MQESSASWLLIVIIVPAFLIVFGTVWWLVVTILRKAAGMRKDVGDVGPVLRQSGYGSARIRGVNCNNCVRVSEHPGGYLFQTMALFGGGKLFLDHATTEYGEPRRRFFMTTRELRSPAGKVTLYGKLVTFVEPRANRAPAAMPTPAPPPISGPPGPADSTSLD